MAQAPIPDDWDGESYCCYVIEWPLSTQWEAILFGLLLNPTIGRFWDAGTGTVTDAQAVGREIEDRNCIYIAPPEGSG